MLDGTLILAVPVLLVVAAFRIRAGMRWRVAAFWICLGVYALWAAGLLFFPVLIDPRLRAEGAWSTEGLAYWINLVPSKTIGELLARTSPTQALRQIGGNVGLLLPLGLLGPVLMPRLRNLRSLVIVALAISVGIEVAQFVGTLTGFIRRSVDIDDVLLNVFGALLGWVLWKAFAVVIARRTTAIDAKPEGESSVWQACRVKRREVD
ncbi:MAG: VanZ family protein [Coriobacteriia bacterium]